MHITDEKTIFAATKVEQVKEIACLDSVAGLLTSVSISEGLKCEDTIINGTIEFIGKSISDAVITIIFQYLCILVCCIRSPYIHS